MKINFNNRSSTLDLYNIAKSIGIKNLKIIRKKDLRKYIHRYENIILNLDDNGAGTHWVALNTSKKLYFDSYNQAPPSIIPSDYKFNKNFEIQAIDDEFCGQLCLIWIWYINNQSEKAFYKLFKDVYSSKIE
jgi:hypothetical protein